MTVSTDSRGQIEVYDPDRIKTCLRFFGLACDDYIAARLVLLNGLAPQGAILASTAIEKYFKGIIGLRGQTCHGHLRPALVNAVRNCQPKFTANLNMSFVDFLVKCYNLRYYDQLEIGFSLVIGCRMLLAELDEIVAQIEPQVKLFTHAGPRSRRYDSLLNSRAASLVLENHVITNVIKSKFLSNPEHI